MCATHCPPCSILLVMALHAVKPFNQECLFRIGHLSKVGRMQGVRAVVTLNEDFEMFISTEQYKVYCLCLLPETIAIMLSSKTSSRHVFRMCASVQ